MKMLLALGVQVLHVAASICRVEQSCDGVLRGALLEHTRVRVHVQQIQPLRTLHHPRMG